MIGQDTTVSIQLKKKFLQLTFFNNKNITLIKPQISKIQVHKCTSDNGWGCRTPCTLDIRYVLIPLHRSNIVNTKIPNKPRLRARFGWIMTKYDFTSPTSKVYVKVKTI